jgi:arginine decarboxylase
MMFAPATQYFIAAGSAEGSTPLNAFDHALLAAGVGDVNIVRMSSILPPSCAPVDPFKLPGGALVPMAYADMVSSERDALIAAAIAIGIPEDPTLPGLIMEHHAVGSLEEVEAQVREMAREGMLHRDRPFKEIISCGVEHRVVRNGAAFACVVLWRPEEVPT